MSILQDLKIKKQSMMMSPSQFKLPFIEENDEKDDDSLKHLV
jgi:hypothetical protein